MMKKTNSMTIKKMETGNAEILTDGENAARAGAKPQIKIYAMSTRRPKEIVSKLASL